MIYVDTPLKAFTLKHGLTVESWVCRRCKGQFQTTRPFLMKDYVGLETPLHECGDGFVMAVLRPRTEKERAVWRGILG